METILTFISGLSLKVKLIAIAVAVAFVFLAGWQSRGWLCDADKLDSLEAAVDKRLAAEKKGKTVADKYEADKALKDSADLKLNEDVKHEIKTVTVYNCVVPDSGVQLYNRAITKIASTK